ncbi:DUF4145 domain-containing protein [Shewanella baltica]|uniref:DUF4145 domain-containing protein n=1 Tax=Shewanella baltica TaxID=62322 RepID=UPI0039AF735F
MLKDSLFTSHFYSDNIPVWPCPKCGVQSLSCEDGSFNKQYKEPIDTSHPEFGPEWIEYIFTMHLKCSNASCGCRVVCAGIGDVSQEYLDDSGDSDWFDNFKVQFFEPPLQIFVPPVDTPHWVKKALGVSFSTFFSSPSASLSALRSALEVLLGEMEISSVDSEGRFLSLAKRINMLPEENRKIVEPANAIRWLGNDGTHEGGFMARKSDVLDGYRIFEHILIELYPEKKASVEALVKRINEAKGLGR